MSYNFGSRYASKPSKHSKDSDDIIDFKKTLSQKIARWVVAQDQVTLAKKSQKHAPIMTSPKEIPNPIRINFF